MSSSVTENLHKLILSLEGISSNDRDLLLQEVKKVNKKLDRQDFKIKRILKDKSIVVNILNETINDLEKNQQKVQEANLLLLSQANELKAQKEIIEAKSIELEDHIRKLELSYKELEQFSYIASHDLKSPLRTISSFAQLLQRRYANHLDEQADEFISFIVSGVYQMNEVIGALLNYSKAGNPEENLVYTDLNEILTIVKANLHNTIKENQAKIIHEQLPTLCVYKTSIIQLFQNLIDNAIKFRGDIPPVIQISSQKLEDGWQFKITDNGIGMSETYQKKVFKPFQRLYKNGQEGMGIGLAICKKVVKMHKGEIYYKSNIDQGTTFTFNLCSLNSTPPSQ